MRWRLRLRIRFDSYGGLFSLYALLSRPGTFTGHIAVSPSVWQAPNLLDALAGSRSTETPPPAGLFCMLGDNERRRGDDRTRGPAPQTMALMNGLAVKAGLDVRVKVLEGLTHGATFAASIPHTFD